MVPPPELLSPPDTVVSESKPVKYSRGGLVRLIIGIFLLVVYCFNLLSLGLALLSGKVPERAAVAWKLMHGYDPAAPVYLDDRASIMLTALAVWSICFALPGLLLVFFGNRARKRKRSLQNAAP